MADIDPKIAATPRGETPVVTTGPIRGSRKVHLAVPGKPDILVAMRAVDLEPSCGEHNTSG